MIQDYLGKQHKYGTFDCILLVQNFYQQELGVSFDTPSYSFSRQWFKSFTLDAIDEWASKYGKKVSLTDARNYDLIIFRTEKRNYATHFGIYIEHNKMLHVEEASQSRIDILDDYWKARIYRVYRHNELV